MKVVKSYQLSVISKYLWCNVSVYVYAQLLSCVQLLATPWTVALQAPLSGSLQARMLEWVAIFSSRESSWPRDQTCISCIGRQVLYYWATGEAPVRHKYINIQNGLPFPTPGDLPNLGIKRASLMSPALAGRFFTTSATWEALSYIIL